MTNLLTPRLCFLVFFAPWCSLIIFSCHRAKNSYFFNFLPCSSPCMCQEDGRESDTLLFSDVIARSAIVGIWSLQCVRESSNEDNIRWHMDTTWKCITYTVFIHHAWASNTYHLRGHARLSFHSQPIRRPFFRFTSHGWYLHAYPFVLFYMSFRIWDQSFVFQTGFLMGPSVPTGPLEKYKKMLFPFGSPDILSTLSSLGYSFYLFLNSVQMDLSLITKTGRKAWVIGLCCYGIPIVVGCGSMGLSNSTWKRILGEDISALPVVFISHSSCSFAVISWLLNDLGILNSELGRLALSAAFVNDVAGTLNNVAFFYHTSWKLRM